jgi:hypothetical protein
VFVFHFHQRFLIRSKKCVQLRLSKRSKTVYRMLTFRPYKITQVHVTEGGDYERRTRICNRFLQAVHDDVVEPELTFFTDEASFHLSGCIIIRSNRYWNGINLRQIFEVPLHNQKICV